MKKFFPILFLAILLFQFTNCKPEGKGKLLLTLEIAPVKDAAAIRQQTMEIIKQRLIGIGIDDEDILLVEEGERLKLAVSGLSNYAPGMAEQIRAVIFQQGKIELWETHTIVEAFPPLMKALGGNDSDFSSMSEKPWNYFMAMVRMDKDFQERTDVCDFGYVLVKDTARMNVLLDSAYRPGFLLHDLRFAWSIPQLINNEKQCRMVCLKSYKNNGARMKSPVIEKVEIEGSGESEQLTFHLSAFDGNSWARMTKENLSKPVAIVVDGIAYTWPVVMGEITGGVFSISGNHNPGEYELLKAMTGYPLPAPVRIVEQKITE